MKTQVSNLILKVKGYLHVPLKLNRHTTWKTEKSTLTAIKGKKAAQFHHHKFNREPIQGWNPVMNRHRPLFRILKSHQMIELISVFIYCVWARISILINQLIIWWLINIANYCNLVYLQLTFFPILSMQKLFPLKFMTYALPFLKLCSWSSYLPP